MIRGEDFLTDLVWFVRPLLEAVQDKNSMQAFLGQFGYQISASAAEGLRIQISSTLDAPLQDISTALSTESIDLNLARRLFAALENIWTDPDLSDTVADIGGFTVEVFDYLMYCYLSTRFLFISAALQALGAFEVTEIMANDPNGRHIDYVRIRMDWGRLGQFISNNGAWAREAYDWGTESGFNHQLAIERLAHLMESALVGLSTHSELTGAEANRFLANNEGNPVKVVEIPIYQTELDHIEADGQPIFLNEAGLRVLPSGDMRVPSDLGFAVAPYTKGFLADEIPLSEDLTLYAAGGAGATADTYLRLSPNGIEVVGDGLVGLDGDLQATFEFGAAYAHADGTPILVLGEAEGTRVEVTAVIASVGGELPDGSSPIRDFFAAAGVTRLRAVIDVSNDGFLSVVVPEPIEIDAGDLVLGWRTGRGVYFEGGTSVSVVVPLERSLGPITVHQVGLQLDWAQDLTITLLLTADATLGPLFAYVENAGLVVTLVDAPDNDGLLGRYDLSFGFRAPTGYAVALDGGPISGGGSLSVGQDEYRGALALQCATVGFSAFAILNTKLPGGKEGFSFVASIFGEFSLPLGYGFFLTGVGGIIGINRTIDTQAMREVLYDGRFDNLLFPSDPIANAATILADMAAIFPAREGQHVFGPVARIAWGVPPVVSGTLGLVLEVGTTARVLVLGGLSSVLPDEDVALIDLNLSFFGEVDFAAGTISFDATLANSRFLVFGVSGDIAARTGWGPSIDHVMSFGGLHPRYPRPANLPDLRRMGINFGTDNPRIALQAYQAITLNSLQFGASASLFAKGPEIWMLGQVAAIGTVYFDALITFNPFAFDVQVGGSLTVLVDDEAIASLGFDLRLRGPNSFQLDGQAWVTVLGFDVRFPIAHTWGTRRTLTDPTADPAVLLMRSLAGGKGFEAVTTSRLSSGVTIAPVRSGESEPINPLGGLQISQSAVPLGVSIGKVGEAHVAGGPQKFDVGVVGQGSSHVVPVRADFIRGHYWALTDAERLRTAAFEEHKAGIEILSAGGLDAGEAIEVDFDYEFIHIEPPGVTPDHYEVDSGAGLGEGFIARWATQGVQRISAPLERQRVAAADAVALSPIVHNKITADYVAAAVGGH